VYGYLKRLVSAGAAYQLGSVVSSVIALALLPLYTRYLSRADYGTAELLLTVVISVSLIVRFGLVDAFVRFYYLDDDPQRRARVTRTATAAMLLTTTVAAVLVAVLAGPLSELVLGYRDATILQITGFSIWSFTNLEAAYALLRVDERKRAYVTASLTNVALTVALTVYLVVVREEGARGLLLGNFGASAVVLVGLWVALRGRLGLPSPPAELGPMLRFGLPTVPAELSVFALNVIDRFYLYRAQSAAAAGLYALAAKLAGVIIIVVRAFQYAYPPLAYSVTDDAEARRLYARVMTYYVLFCGLLVAGLALLGRWVLRVFAAPSFFDAYQALPWVALAWALYGVFLILVVMAGRANVTSRNVVAAGAGLVVNVAGLVLLVDPLGIAGAGISVCLAYVVMIALMYLFTRSLFAVGFEWGRLGHAVAVIAGVTVAGELLLPDDGAAGLAGRLAVLAAIPMLLALTGFLRPEERARLRALLARGRPAAG